MIVKVRLPRVYMYFSEKPEKQCITIIIMKQDGLGVKSKSSTKPTIITQKNQNFETSVCIVWQKLGQI
jgi:hypothetical protein